jgi:hypothetical protein
MWGLQNKIANALGLSDQEELVKLLNDMIVEPLKTAFDRQKSITDNAYELPRICFALLHAKSMPAPQLEENATSIITNQIRL